MASSGTLGYLVITAIEASGKNKDENYVWDSSDFDGYVKGEIPLPVPLSVFLPPYVTYG